MCDFQARRLLELRRQFAVQLPPISAQLMIYQIDEMRWKHMEETGCDCWDEARRENPSQSEVA